MKNIVILGATGSIGTQALEIIKKDKKFKVVGVSANKNIDKLKKIIEDYKPEYVCFGEYNYELINEYPNIKFFSKEEGLLELAKLEKAQIVLNALVGSVGLKPSLEAIKSHKTLLLANKESLVIGGELVNSYLKEYNGTLYPIDSEHSSLWQLLNKKKKKDIKNIYITASGGAFRDLSIDELKNVKKEDALKHPNWSMGDKITIDSATMMNKGFEVIEAYHLFGIDLSKIKTIIHKESIVHALIEYKDNYIEASISNPDMKGAISYALNYPRRKKAMKELDLSHLSLNFSPMDYYKYPSLKLAYDAIQRGGIYPCILNASNEAAVSLFLNDKISFLDIFKINEDSLNRFGEDVDLTLDNILKYDKIVKEYIYKMYS